MKKPFDIEDLKCVVVCGGKGTRLGITDNTTKSLIDFHGKPLIDYIIDYWKQYTNDFIFIVDNSAENIREFLEKKDDIKWEIILENDSLGIANALTYAQEKVGEKFIMVLGDCLSDGEFEFPEGFEQGFGVWKTDNIEYIKRSFSIDHENLKVKSLTEKPEKPINNLCGMGFYFFDRKIFNFIKNCEKNQRTGRVELTDVISEMAKTSTVHAVLFKGDYINLTYPEDLEAAKRITKNLLGKE